ncbi:MAG: glycosyltransferase [Patescibacteria group bacterium]|nr:glycosyltransferase [Patescibacteria group bacterium]
MKKVKVSVIIPVRTITPYVRETVAFLKKQSEKDFEIIIVTDQPESLAGTKIIASGEPTPAYKRNLGAGIAQGKVLAFLDDDSYPSQEWFENALNILSEERSKDLAGVCGPTLTPPKDNLYQKASGWVWATWLGSGGAGIYRNRIMPRREVKDFPSVNLLIKKNDFEKVGGFDINHWPGEDTKLCLDLIKLGKRIIYDPQILVYHHRRAVFLPHLKQISRYALRRGHFARIFPETSFRLGYLIPSAFTYAIIIGIPLCLLFPFVRILYFLLFIFYFLLLLQVFFEVFITEKNLYLAFLTMTAIITTHLTYGFLFPWGFLQKKLKTSPHKIDKKRGVYLGG